MIEINQLSSPASKIALQSEDSVSSLPKFIKNEVVNGKVLKTTSPSDALLLIKGIRVTAKTHLPLREGAGLLLKVEEIFPLPILKVIGPQFGCHAAVNVSAILCAMKENLWKSTLEYFKQSELSKEDAFLFRKLMQDVSMRLFKKPTPELLKAFIDKSGLSWEKKLKEICLQKQIGADGINRLIAEDLKGLGSKLISLSAEKEVLLNRFVSAITNIQVLNHFGLEQDGKIFLPIPIQFPNGLFTIGQLLIRPYQEKEGEHGKKENDRSFYRISFLLELSNLGPLRADLTIREKEIDGRFLLSNAAGKLLVEKNLPFLIKTLTESGFSICQMECHLKKDEIVTQSLIKEIIQEEGCTVSLMA
ncbi:MAG: flagellar hook-length control protein FliK [Desulfobacterales bacterium]|uniref:Flagellar hook-length control protein FliK n=1 Tax=Candidatus Desulfatibia profunda TaxID=2841695 RepID=A0A8J6NQZ7_9BACT|nr:flagellar hook-length control protein FliK [Candidatus Desulfatibia profunda]MBL7179787.1 flagellar hook-length control protein FliK [Desulfobacterales bacterium]MBL7208434.1 flagellar hook-length control protein FliK [Desulfobacterales bacterium]